MARRLIFVLPVLLFAVIAAYFIWGLDPERDPNALPSALIGKPAPAVDLPALEAAAVPALSSADLATGKPVLVNFFASWCLPCKVEHPELMRLTREGRLPVLGIAWKDKPADTAGWLDRLGNPFRRIGVDESGRTGIEYGVSGVPETFVVDGAGVIRYRFAGPLDRRRVEEEILPLVEDLGG